MKEIKKIYLVVLIAFTLIAFNACQQPGGNKTGSEYMPDMAHSIAFEANTYAYYYNNTWGSKQEYHDMAMPRAGVPGTIARGEAGGKVSLDSENSILVPENGSVPYYYGNTDEERIRATNEIIKNPLLITDKGLEVGKELYTIYCGICHGEKGDGAGYLVRDDGGKYPVQPANFLLEEFVASNNGRYYHAIEYGKNLMGNYKDKLSYNERWEVIHYIRSLQAKELKLKYNQYENTLNNFDEPAGDMSVKEDDTKSENHEGNHESDNHEIDGESH